MGLFWGSSSSSPSKPSSTAQENNMSTSTSTSTPTAQSEIPNQTSNPTSPTGNDDEIQKFLDLVTSDSKPNQPSSLSSSQEPSWLSSKIASLTPSSSSSTTPTPAPPRDPLSETLLPTEMSCRQAFDLAWSCNSLGGQWNAVYRHGEMRSCSEKWDDFWFCMRQKSYSPALRSAAVRQHYRNKEHDKYYAPGKVSSEDVWESRTVRLSPGEAFSQSVEAPDVGDDEWRKRESERRRAVRSQLGFNGEEGEASTGLSSRS